LSPGEQRGGKGQGQEPSDNTGKVPEEHLSSRTHRPYIQCLQRP
jgi:hypothetical protein